MTYFVRIRRTLAFVAALLAVLLGTEAAMAATTISGDLDPGGQPLHRRG